MRTRIIAVIPLALACAATIAAPPVPTLDTKTIESLTGASGAWDEKEGVFRISAPRTDLAVTVAGVRMVPALGLTSWAAFRKSGAHVMVMGDMVLLEGQVDAALSAALDNGLEVTALHNHFLWDTPRVMFMHIGGTGDETRLAGAVGKVLAVIRRPAETAAPSVGAGVDTASGTLDARAIEAILGPGESKNGVIKVTIGRDTRMHGEIVGKAMGVNTWAAFAGSDDRAVVDGDVAMLESELQAVLKGLRRAGLSVVAIHQHMTGETPRILFLHFWGVGRAADLAKGIRAALPPG